MAVLAAPADWRWVECISDVHLNVQDPATFALWQRFLETTQADALFILGDLFEVWLGDDAGVGPDALPFEAECTHLLRQLSRRIPVFFLHGNRDFLIGPRWLAAAGINLLADPTVLVLGQRRWLLSHGDALCTADTAYQNFRQQVRSAAWQNDFLARPLAERQALARAMRQQSQAQHTKRQQQGQSEIDLDAAACRQWLQTADAPVLIHGHTHQPAKHALGHGTRRIVLSDWDGAANAQPAPRAEALRLWAGSTNSAVSAHEETSPAIGWERVPFMPGKQQPLDPSLALVNA